jgi:hypothetical protein
VIKSWRSYRGSKWLCALLSLAMIVAVMPLGAPSTSALTYPVTISIDGAFTDWTSVLADATNVQADPTGTSDIDNPASGADLSLVAATWDATYLYGYTRTNTGFTRNTIYYVYVDVGGDGKMGTSDRVITISYNPAGKNANTTMYSYSPSVSGGDTMGGNGSTLPGTLGNTVSATGLSASNISSSRNEIQIPWTALGVTSGSPVNIQFAVNLGTSWDNVAVLAMRYYGMTLVPSNSAAAALGSVATYSHTITNTGNGTETFTLTATSSLGWSVAIKDPGTGATLSSVTLAPGASRTVNVAVSVPIGATPGVKDVTTLRATCAGKTSITAAVTDSTFAGPLLVDPDRAGYMAPGGTIEFTHTVTNAASVAATLSLTATSSQGWATGVFNSGGTSISTVTLSANQSMTVLVRVSVPAGTLLGTIDTTKLRGALLSDPTVFDEASDITSVQPALSIGPDRSSISGVGMVVTYQHAVTNSWSTTRTISLAATSTLGWSTAVYDSDGTTQITSATIGPYGGTRTIYVRVTVPAVVPFGAENTTTVSATFAAAGLLATATDRTLISQLVTYDSGALNNAATIFNQGDTVWANGTNLQPYASVRFRWLNPSGTLMSQSSAVSVDADGEAVSSYSLASDATPGTWTCVLVNAANGAEIARNTFTVKLVPWVTMTVSPAAVDFGLLAPDSPSAIKQVTIQVDSNVGYTFSRLISGTVAEMGLAVTGTPVGSKPTGPATYVDSLQATVPWTTDPSTALSARIDYTVTVIP